MLINFGTDPVLLRDKRIFVHFKCITFCYVVCASCAVVVSLIIIIMFPWSDKYLFEKPKKHKKCYTKRENEILQKLNQDVCSGGELPEVEIVSLLEEQIPKYKLRADSLTEFGGYENQDWFIRSPALKPEDADTSVLSPDTIRETLNYFILCSNRVSQMTKTYNDIEAVTRLLEEKEKDIELTARIGKELLENNQRLENTVNTLEGELKTSNERITQLSHELLKKTELIQILTNDVDEAAAEAGSPTGAINLDVLQRRIGKLEEENTALRSEASYLAAQTDEVELQEQKLVTDFVAQLSAARTDLTTINEEADKYREESIMYKQHVENLSVKLASLEQKLSKSKSENEDMRTIVTIAQETQNELATELADMKERYSEVLGLLEETQELLKSQKRKSVPTVRGGGYYPSLHTDVTHHNRDSLGTELECSLFSELSLDSGISTDRTCHLKKIFDTVKKASKTDSMESSMRLSSQTYPSNDTCSMVSSFNSKMTTTSSEDYSHSDSDTSEDSAYPGSRRDGIPGAPGSADLVEALRKLTPAAVYARRAALSSGTFNIATIDSECRTPDSIMSTGSYNDGFLHVPWKLPEKLQIVKPMEGSQTLHQWSQLARPSMSGLLDDRPGIKTRGEINLEDLGIHLYSIMDVEEDEEIIHPGKSFQESSHVYTLTNSTVLHPDDGTSVVMSSLRGSRMSTACNSVCATAPGTPLRSRRNSTCTFSVTLGLAKLLNERGITAATPSTLVTPNFTPTATPCNSPDSMSPAHSRSQSPVSGFSIPFGLPGYLMSSGAEYLRKTLTGSILEITDGNKERHRDKSGSRGGGGVKSSEKKNTSKMKTGEKVGLESLMEDNTGTNKTGRSRPRVARVRPDLGTVLGSVPVTTKEAQSTSSSSSTLGTISSLLFGRKGGLL